MNEPRHVRGFSFLPEPFRAFALTLGFAKADVIQTMRLKHAQVPPCYHSPEPSRGDCHGRTLRTATWKCYGGGRSIFRPRRPKFAVNLQGGRP
jgi:hypothetical protein